MFVYPEFFKSFNIFYYFFYSDAFIFHYYKAFYKLLL